MARAPKQTQAGGRWSGCLIDTELISEGILESKSVCVFEFQTDVAQESIQQRQYSGSRGV